MTSLPPTVLAVAVDDVVSSRLDRPVTAVASGEEALAAIAAAQPDAILLGESALDVLDRLPADAAPVIVLAASRDALLGALAHGAHDVMVAPFDPAELDARLAAALRVKGLHDALVEAGGYAPARDRGVLRVEGRDYMMRDGDVITVRFTP